MGQEAKRCITWKAFCRFSKRHWYRCPLAFFEWLSSVAIGYLAKVRLVRALEYVGKLALLGALVVWFYPGCNQRKQAVLDARDGKHFQAWQLIDAAYGKPGEDGRSFALVVLNQDNISLQRIDVSGATLPGIQLPYADLRGAVFKNADLTQADFRGAYLSESDFSGANVFQADFSGARMKDVKFDIDPRSLSTGGFIKMSNAVKPDLGDGGRTHEARALVELWAGLHATTAGNAA